MARRSLPQQGVLGDFLDKPTPVKPKLPPGVVEKKVYNISLAESKRTGQPRKLIRTDWYQRIRFREYPGGPRIAAWRKCEKSATDARDVRDGLQEQLKAHGPKSLKHARMTWPELSKHFRDHYLPEYASPKPYLVSLNALDAFFGARLIRSITRGDLKTFKRVRLQTPVVRIVWQRDENGKRLTRLPKITVESDRSVCAVNKELRLARVIFNIAIGEEWLVKNPFNKNDRMISEADETKRFRLMQPDEEQRLLACCDEDHDYLRLLIKGLAYTLTRSESEFYKLTVRDLNFAAGKIEIRQTKTKTRRAREAPLPEIFAEEARRYIEKHKLTPDDFLFPFKSVKRSWGTLKRRAGVEDLRIKDLRRTAATRLHRAGMPLGELMLLLGHTTIEMTKEYIGVDSDTVERANRLLDQVGQRVKEISEAVN